MNCRHCNTHLQHKFLDLGFAPPSNAYLTEAQLQQPELYFPLRLFVCKTCWLVQTEDFADAELLFSPDYAYFSSISNSWLKHAQAYTDLIIDKLKLGKNSLVIEIASNDGYLLKNFIAADVPCIGIEPTASTAEAAEALGIQVIREFFSENLSKQLINEGKKADLIIGNNVYAHVPDINDFTLGIKQLLKPEGVVTLEFPHLLKLLQLNQFDTVYHEHFSYLSLATVSEIFQSVGLRIYDVEELPTHGGSLRIYACQHNSCKTDQPSVEKIIACEKSAGLQDINTYLKFQANVDALKNDFIDFLIKAKKQGKRIVGYGAAAKGNTLLNYAGVKTDLIPQVCDAAPSKQGKYMPGSHIPIISPKKLTELKPDLVMIIPWNIKDEIIFSLKKELNDNVSFFTAVPDINLIL